MAVGHDSDSGACSVVTAAVVAAAVVVVAGTDTSDGLPELDVPAPIADDDDEGSVRPSSDDDSSSLVSPEHVHGDELWSMRASITLAFEARLNESLVPIRGVGGGRAAEREGTFTLLRPPSAPHVAVERRELFPMYGARARHLIDLHVWRNDAALHFQRLARSLKLHVRLPGDTSQTSVTVYSKSTHVQLETDERLGTCLGRPATRAQLATRLQILLHAI